MKATQVDLTQWLNSQGDCRIIPWRGEKLLTERVSDRTRMNRRPSPSGIHFYLNWRFKEPLHQGILHLLGFFNQHTVAVKSMEPNMNVCQLSARLDSIYGVFRIFGNFGHMEKLCIYTFSNIPVVHKSRIHNWLIARFNTTISQIIAYSIYSLIKNACAICRKVEYEIGRNCYFNMEIEKFSIQPPNKFENPIDGIESGQKLADFHDLITPICV